MIKSRTTQLIFQTIYCTLGLIGVIASIGIYDDISNMRWDFYVHFTNISNFFCLGIMLAALIQNCKKERRRIRYRCADVKVYRNAWNPAHLPRV